MLEDYKFQGSLQELDTESQISKFLNLAYSFPNHLKEFHMLHLVVEPTSSLKVTNLTMILKPIW